MAELYAGCVSGAIPKEAYIDIISATGFSGVAITKERVIDLPDETLQPYLSDEDLADFRASGAGILSVTLTGKKS